MATLHVLSHSPFADTRLTSCLRLLGPDDAILLCGDATHALAQSTAPFEALGAHAGVLKMFALEEDVKARGVPVPIWVKTVDYPAFVALSIQYDRVNTWL
jgi:tRNA 2-thiouridine synthesizing protein B